MQDVAEMYLRTKNTSWDYYPDKRYSLADLNSEKISKIRLMIEKNLNIKLLNYFSFLRKYDLIYNEKGVDYPTYAAVLLFANKPPQSSEIQIGLFQDDITIKKSKVIRNDLISELDEVIEFCKAQY